jgi:hypothetical protein
MRKLLALLAGAASLSVIVGCGGIFGDDNDPVNQNNPRVRFVHAFHQGGALNGYIDNQSVTQPMNWGHSSTATTTTQGTHTVGFRTDNNTIIAQQGTNLGWNTHSYVIGYREDQDSRTLVLPANRTLPGGNQGGLRVVATSSAFTDADVYVVQTANELPTASPRWTINANGLAQVTNTIALQPGTYQLIVYPRGTKENAIANWNFTVTANQNQTLVLARSTDLNPAVITLNDTLDW